LKFNIKAFINLSSYVHFQFKLMGFLIFFINRKKNFTYMKSIAPTTAMHRRSALNLKKTTKSSNLLQCVLFHIID